MLFRARFHAFSGFHALLFAIVTLALATTAPAAAGKKHRAVAPVDSYSGQAVLWREPLDWATRDLYYGPGGKEHEPRGPFTFIKEDPEGTNPKFVVQDADGVKWKVKLGLEARPETVATRIVWAAGYFADEDYYLPKVQIREVPTHLHRGRKLINPDGWVQGARLERENKKNDKKIGTWCWTENPFTGSRELNGLRTLMALLNNWDLKDVNNEIYRTDDLRVYEVSDLGTAFGSAGRSWPRDRAKDNLKYYTRSKFIRKLSAETVDFQVPARPRFVYLVDPKEYLSRIRLERVGKNIPRGDARWVGQLLARLTPAQIRDAFRAGGYSPEEIESFARILEGRIQTLSDL